MAYSPSIQSVTQLSNGHAQYTFDNGATLDGGYDTGATGAQGVSITGATLNTSGHLIETLSTGTTIDSGAVPGAGGYPLLAMVASTSNTGYTLKSTDLVGAFLFGTIDATSGPFTFTVDAALLFGGSSTPATTKLLIIKRRDNVTANAVIIATPSGETIDVSSTATEGGLFSLNISANSATHLVRW